MGPFSDISGRVISRSVDFLPMIIFPFSSECFGCPQVEAIDGTFASQGLDSSYLATPDGRVAGSTPPCG
jgi:hypothetical protein